MPSYPRLAFIENRFKAPQTFDNFIVINGIKFRPVLVLLGGGNIKPALQMEVNGKWEDVASITNP